MTFGNLLEVHVLQYRQKLVRDATTGHSMMPSLITVAAIDTGPKAQCAQPDLIYTSGHDSRYEKHCANVVECDAEAKYHQGTTSQATGVFVTLASMLRPVIRSLNVERSRMR
jgi:hypothetical protein